MVMATNEGPSASASAPAPSGSKSSLQLILQTLKKSALKCTSVGGTLLKWGIVAHCTLEYVGDLVICSGPSMEPNIRSHDILLTEHISPRTRNLSRGDIIVARSPNNPSQFICKRIVALPGDHLLQQDGGLQHVPKGHVWIEGDNIDNSTDSRNYGPIPIGLVRGRALVRVWPLSNVSILVPPKAPLT